MLNGSLVVTAKEGTLDVDGTGATRKVAKGQTIVITPKTAANKGGACCGGGNTALEVAAIGAGGVAAILAGVAVSRSGNANTNAQAALSAANAATSAANAATSAATAATSAANAAGSAATYAGFLAACAADQAQQGNTASASQMYGGSQCPTYNPGTTPAP